MYDKICSGQLFTNMFPSNKIYSENISIRVADQVVKYTSRCISRGTQSIITFWIICEQYNHKQIETNKQRKQRY